MDGRERLEQGKMPPLPGLSLGLFQKLLEPHATVTGSRRRQAARAVTGLTLALLIPSTAAAVVYSVWTRSLIPQVLIVEAILLGTYLLSRSPWPQWSGGLLVVGMSVMIFFCLPRSSSPALSLIWVLVPVSLAMILLSMRAAMVLTLLDLVGVVVTIRLVPAIRPNEASIILLALALVLLIAVMTKYIHERDIKTLERQARELIESQARYRRLFDDMPIGLYEITPSGRVLDANPACVELLGFADRAGLLSANAADLYVDAAWRERWKAIMEREGAVHHFESQLRRPDGRVIWVREGARATRDETGQIVSYRGSIEDITGSKLAETELITLASVIEQSLETVILADRDGTIIYANPVFEQTSGYTVPEALGRNSHILESSLQDPGLYKNLWDTLLAGQTWTGVLVNKRRDGSLYYEEAAFFPIKDVLGKTIHYAAVKRDVTERILTQERLEQRNLELATLNALAQALSSSLHLNDLLNEALSRTILILGFTGGLITLADERTGELTLASCSGLPLPFLDRLERAGLGGTLCEHVYREGHPLWLDDLNAGAPADVRDLIGIGVRSYAGVPIVHQERTLGTLCLFDTASHSLSDMHNMLLTAIGQQIGIAVAHARLFTETQERVRELQILHDVGLAAAFGTRLEETQQAATEALAARLPTAAVALLLVDPSRGDLRVQASAGYAPGALENRRIRLGEGITGWVAQHGRPALVPDVSQDGRYLQVASDVRSELCVPLTVNAQVIGVLNVESPQLNAFAADDQRLLSVLANNLAVLIERARLFEQVEAARTELQQRAEELSRANRRLQELDRLKGEFLAHMSHELRTPLNAILGFAQLMQRSPSFPPDHRESLQVISRSGEHLLDLINDVLDMSKIEAGHVTLDPTSFDLHSMLDGVRAMIGVRAEKKGLRLDVRRAPDVPQFVKTDERKLRQVLINLLNNAVKFTDHGRVTLRVGRPGQAEGAAPAGDRLCFEVQDTGVGIAPKEMDMLFQPFTQTASGKKAQEGTGLGLPISRKFVQLMGGDLTVSSQVGRGSTFRFDIQVEPPEMDRVTSEQVVRHVVGLEPGQPEYRILIVDDQAENRLLVRQILETVGLSVQEAANGQEAVHVQATWKPHLILMDMRMPVMDGYEATQRIKAAVQEQATVIVALTASALEEERAAILSSGCDDYIRKPFRDADILSVLTQRLGVRYIYAGQEPADGQAGAAPARLDLTPELLAVLPAGWRAQLRDAAGRARGDLVLELLAQIEPEHAPIARALSQFVDEFQFDRIISLLERQKGD